jgi:hypothetical protein
VPLLQRPADLAQAPDGVLISAAEKKSTPRTSFPHGGGVSFGNSPAARAKFV